MPSHRIVPIALVVLLFATRLAAQVAAQGFSQDTTLQRELPGSGSIATPAQALVPATVDRAPLGVPATANTPAGVHRIATPATPARVLSASDLSRGPMAMMVVGGAALVVGALIGGGPGAIIMVGGGVLGLVGLWNYMQ